MTRIAYVDHSYHRKTKSTDFLALHLGKIGTVERYWDDSWSTGTAVDWTSLNSGGFGLLVFFQILPSVALLNRLTCRSIVLIPMYDSVGDAPLRDWAPYRRYSFLSFSEKTHRDLTRLGMASFRLQYFPDPTTVEPVKPLTSQKVFFWERSDDVTVSTVGGWFQNYPGMAVHHHESLDPGQPEVRRKSLPAGWTSSQWFETREAYQTLVATCSIYLAPRKREGIGMSFLEAMARGMVVVGWNHATLSEYIVHGENGLLLSEGESVQVGIAWARLGQAARRSVELGYRRYREQLDSLDRWLLALIAVPPKMRMNWVLFFALLSGFFRNSLRRLKRLLVSLRGSRR